MRPKEHRPDGPVRTVHRFGRWVTAVGELFARRPDLVGVHTPADVALESVTSAA